MSNASRITYLSLPDVTPEQERNALAAVYRLILNRHVEKKAANEDGGEGREEEMNFTRGPPQS
ncbi:MAG: hypothetical protein ICV68_18540 [Pyrinomonadaceae bacterium]|nr:hypothetical protein [Pyrinomonadaceae bacterium]